MRTPAAWSGAWTAERGARPLPPRLLVAVALLLGGCASLAPPPQTQALIAAPAPLGLARVERTEVPFYPQTPYHCGPAALATVLTHAGLPTRPDDLAEALFLPAREGTLQTEMLAGARRRGALAYRMPGELAVLLREVAAGHPVVVLQNLGLAIAPRWHYAVLVGYDLPQRELVLRSGVTKRETMPLHTFEHTWARGGHWAIVVLPPGRLPAGVDEAAAVDAAVGFERSAPPPQAAIAWQTVLRRWPGNLVAGLGVGNARLAAGRFDAAAQAFESAAKRHDSAVAWNNLAQARLRQGRHAAAAAAAGRALQRAQTAEPLWLEAARDTQREIEQAGLRDRP